MEEIQFELVDNVLTAEDFVRLKVATGFIERPLHQVEKALKNGLFNVSAICDGKVVGMGRLVGSERKRAFLSKIRFFHPSNRNGTINGNTIKERITHP